LLERILLPFLLAGIHVVHGEMLSGSLQAERGVRSLLAEVSPFIILSCVYELQLTDSFNVAYRPLRLQCRAVRISPGML